MVKLTLDLIARGTSRHTQRKRDENLQQFVRRLTHLYLDNKNIDDVGEDLSLCRNLVVVYMYDNQISHVPCLRSSSSSLTYLYLQNNNISKIENLASLTQLQKLFLGGNTITVLEGLEKLQQLQELHVENQRLPQSEHLLFDPRSIQGISETLQVLDVSGNNLTSISELENLSRLTQLMVMNNQLSDLKEMAHHLSSWKFLWRLDLTGNPLCQKPKYRDQVIVMGKNLEMLDGKAITTIERQFLLSWQAMRDLHSKRLQENLMRQDTFSSMSSEVPGGRNLLPALSATRHPAGYSATIVPGLQRKQFKEILDKVNFAEPSRTRKSQSGIVRTNYTNTQDTRMNGQELMCQRNIPRPLSVECIHLQHSAHRRRL